MGSSLHMLHPKYIKETGTLPYPATEGHLLTPHHSPRRTRSRACFALGFLAICALTSHFSPSWHQSRPQPIPGTPRNPAYLIRATNGAVASENKICSEVGVDILKKGGNAVDSAVATTFCIGVANMFSCVLLASSMCLPS